MAEFEDTENPELIQVDNFSNSDGEVDQPVYEGPQTQSHTSKLMKANLLMNNLFYIQSGEILMKYWMFSLWMINPGNP